MLRRWGQRIVPVNGNEALTIDAIGAVRAQPDQGRHHDFRRERSGTIARGTNGVSAAPLGTNTLAVTKYLGCRGLVDFQSAVVDWSVFVCKRDLCYEIPRCDSARFPSAFRRGLALSPSLVGRRFRRFSGERSCIDIRDL